MSGRLFFRSRERERLGLKKGQLKPGEARVSVSVGCCAVIRDVSLPTLPLPRRAMGARPKRMLVIIVLDNVNKRTVKRREGEEKERQ